MQLKYLYNTCFSTMDVYNAKYRYKKFTKSYNVFQRICEYISNIKKYHNLDYEILESQLNQFFEVKKCDVKNFINILNETDKVLKIYMALPKLHKLSNIKIYKKFYKEYNQTITQFRLYLKENTTLDAITTVNKYCVLHQLPYVILTDVLTLEQFHSNESYLKFDDGYVTQFIEQSYF